MKYQTAIREGTTASEIAAAWHITLSGLERLLGPLPNPSADVPPGLGDRIMRALKYRSSSMSASELVAAVKGNIYSRQVVYATAAKMVNRGLIRRPRHGFYERIGQ